MKKKYQLWVLIETREWVMRGFFDSVSEANDAMSLECGMFDFEIVKVKVSDDYRRDYERVQSQR